MSIEHQYFDFNQMDRTLAFLEDGRDPDLWHQIVDGLNYDSPWALDYVLWIVRQPDCDLATAALAFVSLRCAPYVYGAPDTARHFDDRHLRIATEICHRSAASHYTRAKIGWHAPEHHPSPASVLADIRSTCHARGLAPDQTFLPIPEAVLGANFDKPPAPVNYFVDEGGFSHMNTMDPFMQAIMGFKRH